MSTILKVPFVDVTAPTGGGKQPTHQAPRGACVGRGHPVTLAPPVQPASFLSRLRAPSASPAAETPSMVWQPATAALNTPALQNLGRAEPPPQDPPPAEVSGSSSAGGESSPLVIELKPSRIPRCACLLTARCESVWCMWPRNTANWKLVDAAHTCNAR